MKLLKNINKKFLVENVKTHQLSTVQSGHQKQTKQQLQEIKAHSDKGPHPVTCPIFGRRQENVGWGKDHRYHKALHKS